MAKTGLSLALGFVMVAAPILSQSTRGARPAFEVASITANDPGETGSFMTGLGDAYIATGESLKALIAYAYRVQDFQIVGAADWIASDRWAIEAKAALGSIPQRNGKVNPDVPDTKALMLQSLLADRFKLSMHRETRQLPVYELSVADGEPKVRPSKKPPVVRTSASGFSATAMPLSSFVAFLASRLDGPVIDKTALAGFYDFELSYIPDAHPGSSILAALREQLGLQLVSKPGPVDVWVIDSAQKPNY